MDVDSISGAPAGDLGTMPLKFSDLWVEGRGSYGGGHCGGSGIEVFAFLAFLLALLDLILELNNNDAMNMGTGMMRKRSILEEAQTEEGGLAGDNCTGKNVDFVEGVAAVVLLGEGAERAWGDRPYRQPRHCGIHALCMSAHAAARIGPTAHAFVVMARKGPRQEVEDDTMEEPGYEQDDLAFPVGDIAKMLFEKTRQMILENPSEARFFGHGGCNDAFTVFGFLAFLLALFDLILELQNDNAAAGATARRRRDLKAKGDEGGAEGSSPSEEEEEYFDESITDEEVTSTATSACFSMMRGFMNAQATEDPACARRFLCEGAEEAAALGTLGRMIAIVASSNAAHWLERRNSTLYKGVGEAGETGAKTGNCGPKFSQCFQLPKTYRYPRVYTGDPEEDFKPSRASFEDYMKWAM